MGLSLGSLQILASLNLTTEQMAGVVRVLTVELAPLEEEEARIAEQRDKARLRKAKSRQCHADKSVTEAGQGRDQASRVGNLSSLPETIETVRNPLVIPPNSSEPPFFEAFWDAYPKRAGSRDRKGAVKAFRAATKRTAPAIIIEGALQYANFCRLSDKEGTEFIKQARSWLNADGWTEIYEIPRSTNGSPIRDNWAIASAVLREQDRREGIRREGSEDDLCALPEPEGRA